MKTSPNRKISAILIDDQFCKGCHLCIQMCPKKLFSRGEKRSRGGYRMPDISDVESCSGCLLCEMTCPDLAITVQKEIP